MLAGRWQPTLWPDTASLRRCLRAVGAQFAAVDRSFDLSTPENRPHQAGRSTDGDVALIQWYKFAARSGSVDAARRLISAAALSGLPHVLIEPIGPFDLQHVDEVMASLASAGMAFSVIGPLPRPGATLPWLAFSAEAHSCFVRLRTAGELGLALALGARHGVQVVPVLDCDVLVREIAPSDRAERVRAELSAAAGLATALDCPLALESLETALHVLGGDRLFGQGDSSAPPMRHDSTGFDPAAAPADAATLAIFSRSTTIHER